MNSRELYASVSSPWNEFHNHPGQIAHVKWKLLQDFYQDVVRVNGIKLIMLSELPQVDKRARRKLMREVMTGQNAKYNGEITRLLYNYLVSAATLTDHCRYIMRNYEGAPYYKEYRQKVEEFSRIPEVVFYKDLRNYFTHYKIPSIGLSVGDADFTDNEFRHEALIYTSDLSDSTKWSAKSKDFIEAHYPHIYIAEVTKSHLSELADLYSWIFSSFERLHKEEFEQLLKIRERILQK